MTYRAFIGDWCGANEEPDYVIIDKEGLSWSDAVKELETFLHQFVTDECDECRQCAVEGIVHLTHMEPGPFGIAVNGDKYMIIPE